MRRLSFLIVLLCSTAFAEPNEAQQAKMRGKLLNVPLAEVANHRMQVSVLRAGTGLPICGHPDVPDPEIARADPRTLQTQLGLTTEEEAIFVQEMHWRYMQAIVAAATGRGAYPPNCNPKYPGVHSVAYYEETDRPAHLTRTLTESEFQDIIDARVWGPTGDPRGPPFTMEQLKSAWGDAPMWSVVNDFAEETYRRWGVILYAVDTGPNGEHNIHCKFPVIPGSTIGVGWFPGDDPCPGDHVNLHIDRTYTAGFQGQLGLKIHELGHTLQLPHQFQGELVHQEPLSYSYRKHLVNGFSDGDPVFGLPRAPSAALLTRLYGGKPEGVPWKGKRFSGTPPPDERLELDLEIEMIDGRPVIRNEFTVRGRRFIIVPRPSL